MSSPSVRKPSLQGTAAERKLSLPSYFATHDRYVVAKRRTSGVSDVVEENEESAALPADHEYFPTHPAVLNKDSRLHQS